MIIKLLMMCKNESDMLDPWIKYHGSLFGYRNLYIFDNGSTEAAAKKSLIEAESLGVHVDRSHPEHSDFIAKGDILAAHIKKLDIEDPADFYIPIDCDELLGVEDASGATHFDADSIELELAPFLNYPGALMISAAYNNMAGYPKRFSRIASNGKTFFARNACVFLDNGFHAGHGVQSDARQATRIVYVHFHYKPYDTLVMHSRQKLCMFTDDFSEAGLRDYMDKQLTGFHVAQHLLTTKEKYYASFDNIPYIELPSLRLAFDRAKAEMPFSSAYT